MAGSTIGSQEITDMMYSGGGSAVGSAVKVGALM